jgi:hypothetical protein
MDELKKYNWTISTYEGVQIIKHEQGSFYIGDIDIEDVKISEYPNGFNLSQEEIDKLDKGDEVVVEKLYRKKFIITKDD